MNDKVCVVTGGANGIGRAIAETFVAAGYIAAVIDVDEAAGRRLCERFGGRISFYKGDIAEKSVLDGFAEYIKQSFGRVDALINNACLSRGGVQTCGYEDFNYVLRVGVSAPFYLAQQLMPLFSSGASIVNISSTRALMSQSDTESYSAAKGGISALTHALSISLAGRARVNSISPGWIDTGAYHGDENYTPAYSEGDTAQHPAGRVGTPLDIAETALYLCSGKASFITGENITVDGGMTKLMIYHGDRGWIYNP